MSESKYRTITGRQESIGMQELTVAGIGHLGYDISVQMDVADREWRRVIY